MGREWEHEEKRSRTPFTDGMVDSVLRRARRLGSRGTIQAVVSLHGLGKHHHLKARNRDAAYKKAVRIGSSNRSKFSDAVGKKNGGWVFEGLTSLLPIYEELEDGAEILWSDHSGRTLKTIRAKIKKKRELEAFAD